MKPFLIRRQVFWVIIFVVVLFIFDRLGGVILHQILKNSNFRYSLLYRGNQPESIIILGSSRGVNTFYTPEIQKKTGHNAINLSFNALPPVIEEEIIGDYLMHNQLPKAIILEISNIELPSSYSYVNTLKPYDSFSEALTYFVEKTDRLANFKCKLSNLYCFNNILFFRTLYYLFQSDQTWINNGQLSQEQILQLQKSTGYSPGSIIKENFTIIKRIIALANAENISIRLVLGPIFPNNKRNPDIDEFISVVERRTGTLVWDYSNSVRDPTAFADGLHLNKKGSVILVDQMIADGLFSFNVN